MLTKFQIAGQRAVALMLTPGFTNYPTGTTFNFTEASAVPGEFRLYRVKRP